jgi:glycerophosphoryl diester phosphodiesterase
VPRRGDRYGRGEGVTGLLPRAPSEVEVVAHRGVSAEAPEHTLAAYQQALALGADAVECDVRMTRDGVLVCVHDRRINRTSTGRGVVSALDLAELERHRVVHRRGRGAGIRGRPRRPAVEEPCSPASGGSDCCPAAGRSSGRDGRRSGS